MTDLRVQRRSRRRRPRLRDVIGAASQLGARAKLDFTGAPVDSHGP